MLSERIKELRTTFGINQVKFAEDIGVTKQCVSNWENDNVLPSIEMLVKIAKYFSVSCDYLLGLEDRKTIDVSELTSEQIAHITLIVKDMK